MKMSQVILKTKGTFQKICKRLKDEWQRGEDIDRAIQNERTKCIQKFGPTGIYRY